ncbi:pectinesterase family protein [Terriglobus saanensis]|uniref:Pectinesterase n=1 Tax=Terriglobus saanensis (strain ATCC BAA-1853 / DSM 23119 / SP1PR4) TaxID=401053 RepID=E8V1Z8_TERSS|nr:pectinesterase family protein [Terriglobus saanensis]ADV83486.1 Pectinesterase [Terriglobus saanensis SP1PR4]
MLLRSYMMVLFTLLSCSLLEAQDVHIHVSPTSTGTTASTDDFPTIQMALDHAPDVGPRGRLYLHIAPGTYRERVWVSPLRARTTLLGTGSDPSQVVITAAQNAKTSQSTFFSETVEVNGDGFQADNITFENTAGNNGQAVAIAVHSDRAIFKRCRFLGDQDTLLANFGRQYYVDSYIQGGVDFIFGNAAAVFEKSEIHIARPGYLTAQSRTQPWQATGFVFQHSRVTADDFGDKVFYLGRPWRLYSRVVFLDTELPASLSPEGWSPWKHGDEPRDTFYAERNSSGPGARAESRVSWSHQLTARQAIPFGTLEFLAGKDHWNPVREAANLP